MKDCLVSFSSNGREDYNKGLLRLIDSALIHWDGDILCYSTDHTLTEYKGIKIHKGLPKPKNIRSYPHAEMPYQFKIAIIQQALEMGYDKIVWLDSSMVIKKSLIPLFDETGVTVFHNLGHDLYKYISDEACKLLGLSENDLKGIKQIWGGALLFDFSKKNCIEVFEKIKTHSVDGSFKNGGSIRKGFIAHRHDQSVMSVLVNGRCNMQPYGKIVCAPHDTTFEYGTDIYLTCRGI